MTAHKLPDLKIKHHRILTHYYNVWDLEALAYLGGTRIKAYGSEVSYKLRLRKLKVKHKQQIDTLCSIKKHAESLLDTGVSEKTIFNIIGQIRTMYTYLDVHILPFGSIFDFRNALFKFSEHLFTRANLGEIKHKTAYSTIARISNFLNGAFEELDFQVKHTRLQNGNVKPRALSRSSEKMMITNAQKLANFCFTINSNFDCNRLISGILPIVIRTNNLEINLTPGRKHEDECDTNFHNTEAHLAFNIRVSSEVMVFLAMTIQNGSPAYSLKRSTFDYKPIGEKYEVREYKYRRGGEVLFQIPKSYKQDFEKYLSFLAEFAPETDWLFPYLRKNEGFRKRTSQETLKLKRFVAAYDIPWIPPSIFRKIGENILMRLASDETTAADFANHAVATFRKSYEFPSLLRAQFEVGKFWDENDPLVHGEPQLSLFSSKCSGVPTQKSNALHGLPKPDCITPSGCIGCDNFRDENSFDYVWGLYCFRFLKIIESGSHSTDEDKPSNIAIRWANQKINWFKTSDNDEHKEWCDEAEMRLEEADYHPTWSRKIEKYEV